MLPSLNDLIKKFEEFDDINNKVRHNRRLSPSIENLPTALHEPSQQLPSTTSISAPSSSSKSKIIHQFPPQSNNSSLTNQHVNGDPGLISPIHSSYSSTCNIMPSYHHISQFYHPPSNTTKHDNIPMNDTAVRESSCNVVNSVLMNETQYVNQHPSNSSRTQISHNFSTSNSAREHLTSSNVYSTCDNSPNMISQNDVGFMNFPTDTYNQKNSQYYSTKSPNTPCNVNKKKQIMEELPKNKDKISKKSKEPIQFKAFSLSLDTSKIKFINEQHQKIGINDGSWTEKEHEDFIRGLNECGKGKWREIAEGFVKTRTRTQVASHARKYLEMTARKKL